MLNLSNLKCVIMWRKKLLLSLKGRQRHARFNDKRSLSGLWLSEGSNLKYLIVTALRDMLKAA